MARKFLYAIAVLIVMVIAALLALRIWSAELTRFAFVPRGAFEAQAPLRAGTYDDPAMWVSRPGTPDDPAQYRPEGSTPAHAPSHGLAGVIKLGKDLPAGSSVLINLSGRGDKDMETAGKYFGLLDVAKAGN